jgi:hypothetical protein
LSALILYGTRILSAGIREREGFGSAVDLRDTDRTGHTRPAEGSLSRDR